MGELAASLAHELNQPLTAILSNAQAAESLLAADPVNLQGLREIVTDIIVDDKRAGDVIGRLRALVKKGDFEQVSLDLNEVVREVAWLMRNDTVIRNVSMSLEVAADPLRVRGDRVQLQQVVLNLVLNGLEAMQTPGADDRTLVIRTARDGAAVVSVSVQDSGGGIAAGDMDRMFQPLYTTKTTGLGMGLAIARTIVAAHGGRLGAANNVHAGATVHFTLPVDTEDEP
jgi:two-component system sensor kinase FixL